MKKDIVWFYKKLIPNLDANLQTELKSNIGENLLSKLDSKTNISVEKSDQELLTRYLCDFIYNTWDEFDKEFDNSQEGWYYPTKEWWNHKSLDLSYIYYVGCEEFEFFDSTDDHLKLQNEFWDEEIH